MKIIIKNNKIIDYERKWDAKYYIKKAAEYGFSISFPENEPENIQYIGNEIKIIPVIYEIPQIDSTTQKLSDPIRLIKEDNVLITYEIIENIVEQEEENIIHEPYLSETGKYYDENMVAERKKYENKYLETTKSIMKLAGMPVDEDEWPKLEDTDYENIGLEACVNNPALGGFLLTSLTYLYRTLKTDFEWKWEDIEYRSEIIES
jgi:hypothetical protein